MREMYIVVVVVGLFRYPSRRYFANESVVRVGSKYDVRRFGLARAFPRDRGQLTSVLVVISHGKP